MAMGIVARPICLSLTIREGSVEVQIPLHVCLPLERCPLMSQELPGLVRTFAIVLTSVSHIRTAI